MINLVPNN